MTGELFDVISKYSILAHAVDAPDRSTKTEMANESFRKGVLKSLESPLLNSLFSVRVNQLKKYIPNKENYFYLSGLLIGSEIDYLRKSTRQLILCSSGNLKGLYSEAITFAGLKDRTMIVAADILDKAASAGQLKIFTHLASKTI
jgi:2-dehydro-3-deoxygalactonokinase